jgi:hypothetical protein
MASQYPHLTAFQEWDFDCSAMLASHNGSLSISRHVRPDQSQICIKQTFRATGMNWTISKKTMINTGSITTIPPPDWTMIMMSYCQLMNKIDAVATQSQKTCTGITQTPSRWLTVAKGRNPNQTMGAPMETALGCRYAHNHHKAFRLNFLAKIRLSSFQWTMPDGHLQAVGTPHLPLHLLKVCWRRRATRIARCRSITKQLWIKQKTS